LPHNLCGAGTIGLKFSKGAIADFNNHRVAAVAYALATERLIGAGLLLAIAFARQVKGKRKLRAYCSYIS
jgi:hypothetical protein